MIGQLDTVAVQIGLNLRRLRTLAGLSQTELGQHLGMSFQQIQKYERGTNNVSGPNLDRLRRILGCDLDDFFVGIVGSEMVGTVKTRKRQLRVVSRLSRAVLAIDDSDVQERLILLAQAIAGLDEKRGRT